MKLITSISKVKELAPFDGNIDDILLTHFLQDAQQQHLMPLIGQSLIITLATSTNTLHTTLVDGNDNFAGLAKVLSMFTYADYVATAGVRDTPYGVVKKIYEDGESISGNFAYKLKHEYIAKAYSYYDGCKEYMDKNSIPYTKGNRKRMFSISKII